MINSSSEFASFADEICSTADSLYLPEDKVVVEPEEVKYATDVPDTLQIHKWFDRKMKRDFAMSSTTKVPTIILFA